MEGGVRPPPQKKIGLWVAHPCLWDLVLAKCPSIMLLVALFFTKSICLALFYLELFIFIFTSSTQTCANVGIESVPFCNDWRGNQSPLPVADMMIWYNPGDSLLFFSLCIILNSRSNSVCVVDLFMLGSHWGHLLKAIVVMAKGTIKSKNCKALPTWELPACDGIAGIAP